MNIEAVVEQIRQCLVAFDADPTHHCAGCNKLIPFAATKLEMSMDGRKWTVANFEFTGAQDWISVRTVDFGKMKFLRIYCPDCAKTRAL